MNILAVIPARAGSKGLPGKNIKALNGHPLIAYSIAAALQSDLITRTICTTDSEEIKDIAQKYGAEVPFLRPKLLAGDNSTDLETFQHAVDWLEEKQGYQAEIIVQLRPTSPIRSPGIIDRGIRLLIDNPAADSVRSICEPSATPFKMWLRKENHPYLHPLLDVPGIPEPFNSPRQILPQVWWQTGVLDITRKDVIVHKKSMTGTNILPLLIQKETAVDIDNRLDFVMAGLRMKEIDHICPKI